VVNCRSQVGRKPDRIGAAGEDWGLPYFQRVTAKTYRLAQLFGRLKIGLSAVTFVRSVNNATVETFA
jgi:4-alpha-glucanotransferase